MIEKLANVFASRGYLKVGTGRAKQQLLIKVSGGSVYYVCIVDDIADHMVPGSGTNFLRSAGQFIRWQKEFSRYAENIYGLLLIITNNPAQSRSLVSEGDSYWLIDQTLKRLMIYEDQPETFCDAKECVESYLNQSPLRQVLSGIKGVLSPINATLILINILIYIHMFAISGNWYHIIMKGALTVYNVLEKGEVYRLLTCAFLHFGLAHLVYNMIALLCMGKPLEQAMGSTYYLAFYMICAAGSSVVSLGWRYMLGELFVMSAGASGAICGVAGGLAYVMLKNRNKVHHFSFLRWAIFLALVAGQGIGSSGVDNAAHIGGVVVGFLLAIPMYGVRKDKKLI